MIWISTQVRRPSKMGKIIILEIILGDKQTHSNNNNASYIFNVRVWPLHNQNKIFWATAQSGKALLLFSGWSIVSREDAWVFLVSQRDTHMPAQTETLKVFFKKPLSQFHDITKSCLTPLLPAQQQPEWTHDLGVWLVLENTVIMQPEDEVLLPDF